MKCAAKLSRKRPAYNPIGGTYLEMIIAVDTWNPFAALAHEFIARSNMNLLFGFTAWAFDRHNGVLMGFHRRLHAGSMRKFGAQTVISFINRP